MNFDFSDDQKLLKEQVRRLLQDKCSLGRVRAVLEGDESYAQDVWRGLCDLGVAGAAISEDYGGAGLGALELCVIAEELGRSVAPVPFSSSIYFASEALRLYGRADQKDTWLSRLASGSAIGTIGMAEGVSGSGSAIETTYADGKLNGRKLPVADAILSDVMIVLAQSDEGLSFVLVDMSSSGVSCTPIDTIDPSRSYAVVDFKDVSADILGDDAGLGLQMRSRLEDGAAVFFAFEQIGGAAAALAMARDYALERYAFGRQIGSYQAIKHKLADMYVKLELARSNAYYAAMVLSEDSSDLPIAAAAARVSASEAYYFAARENIQTHGGIGFTWEADTQFHYRRAGLLKLVIGGPLRWKERIVSALERHNDPRPA